MITLTTGILITALATLGIYERIKGGQIGIRDPLGIYILMFLFGVWLIWGK